MLELGSLPTCCTLEFSKDTMLHLTYHKNTLEVKPQLFTSFTSFDSMLQIIIPNRPSVPTLVDKSFSYAYYQALEYSA